LEQRGHEAAAPRNSGVHKTMETLLHLIIIVSSFLLLFINVPRIIAIDSPFFLNVDTIEGRKTYHEIREISGLPGEEKTLDSSQAMELELFIRNIFSSEKRARATIALIAFFSFILSLRTMIKNHLKKKPQNERRI
jgi:hypothetical protein